MDKSDFLRLGLCIGLLGGYISDRFIEDRTQTLKFYNYGNNQTIVREFVNLGRDRIFSYDKNSNNYILLDKYLNKNFQDKHDRNIEKAKIEKIVDW